MVKLCEVATDQQLAVFALLVICALSGWFRVEGTKDLLLMVAGAIAGWMSSKAQGSSTTT